MNTAFLFGVTVLLSSSAAMAQSANWQKTWDETLTAARKEGKVVVAGPPDTQVRQLLPAAFEARYGIKMEYITGRGSDQSTRLKREREAGIFTVDAVLAGSQTMFTVLHREKILAPLKPSSSCLKSPTARTGSAAASGSWIPNSNTSCGCSTPSAKPS
jgi:iron(III) transport system substrate-binding protein